LLAKRDEIALPASWAWVEKLDLSCPPVQLDNVHDDLKREAAFYERTLAAVKQGLIQLRHAGVPYQRPADFFAEMIKPDSQMAKVSALFDLAFACSEGFIAGMPVNFV